MLNNWFEFRLDYINLWYGVIFYLLAIVAYKLQLCQRSNSKGFLFWNKFVWFAFLYGSSVWCADLYVSLRNLQILNYCHIILYLSSLYFLYEFAYKSSEYQEIKIILNHYFYLFFIFLGFIVAYFKIDYLVFVLAIGFGLPSIIQCVYLFKNLSKKTKENAKDLFNIILFFSLFASFKLFLMVRVYLLADCYTHSEDFINSIFAVLYYITVTFAGIFIFYIWHYAKQILKERKSVIFRGYYLPVTCVLFFIAGLGLVEWRTTLVDSDFRSNMLRIAVCISRALDRNEINSLSFTNEDENKLAYNTICKQLYLTRNSFRSSVSYIYILKKDYKDSFSFGPQSDLKNDLSYVLPGSNYTYNNSILKEIYDKGIPNVYGPYKDNFGNFITAYMPVYEAPNSSKVSYILALDIESEIWKTTLEKTRAIIIIGLMIVIGLPLLFLAFMVYRRKVYGYNPENQGLFPYFTFFYGLTLSILVSLFVNTIYIEKSQQDFFKQADSDSLHICHFFDSLKIDLNSLQKFLTRHNSIMQLDDFNFLANNYFNHFERPVLKWLDIVEDNNLENYEKSVQAEKGFENFKVTDYRKIDNNSTLKKAAVYFPVRYAYPESVHKMSLGCDYNSEKNLSNILNYVYSTKLLSANCMSDSVKHYLKNISFFIPVPDKITDKINNFLIYTLSLQDVIDEIMSDQNYIKHIVEFEIEDLVMDKGVNILAKYPKSNIINEKSKNNKKAFTFICPVYIYGRTLSVNLRPSDNYLKDIYANKIFIAVLLSGILFTCLIVVFVTFQQKKQIDLERLVNERTQEIFKRENLIKTISDNLPIVSYRCTPEENRKFTFISSEIIHLCGIAPSDFLVGNKSMDDVIYPNDIEYVKKSINETSPQKRHFDIEYRIIGPNGKIIWVNERGHMALGENGKPSWIDGTIADVTERREATSKLNESLYELEKTNNELKLQTERANQFAEEAKIADEAKSKFLANIRHEIRTPMNAIIGMSDLLKETEQTPIQRRYTDIICSSSENLLALINNVLDFSKMEAGRMKLEKISFNLSENISDVVKMFILKANQKKIYLNYEIASDVPLYLIGDPYRLKQVLINLVSNAIRFTEEGGITIKISLIQQYEDDIVLKFTVMDTGVGIERKNIGKLFNVFEQIDGSTARKYGGSGLGLAICKQIVELFYGQIGVESDVGKGSEFWFTARLAIEKEQDVIDSLNKEKETVFDSNMDETTKATKKILVVEDNEINQQVSVALLEKLGFKSEIAKNGEEAIIKLSEKPYDLVLMDCQMPGIDGLEACRKIRKGEAGPINANVVIIALTANVLSGEKARCIKAGMNDYICKPVQSKYLLAKLEKWFSDKAVIQTQNDLLTDNTDENNNDSTQEDSSSLVSKQEPEEEDQDIANCLQGLDTSIIDCKDLSQRLMNDEALIKKILKTFNNIAPGIIETLRFAVEAENYELAKEQAHSLKGSAATISAINLEKIASELENYYINSDYGRAPECFQRLEKEYNRLQREIY